MEEVLQSLNVKADGVFVDGTFGRGGHSAKILSQLGADGRLYAADRDLEAIEYAKQHFTSDSRFSVEHGLFSDLVDSLNTQGLTGKVDGILLDLGVSSPQLDSGVRGFSFSNNGPLDMRMDQSQGETAAQWLARAEESEIADVIYRFGEERYSRKIAKEVIKQRQNSSIETTKQLADLVANIIYKQRKKGHKKSNKHPATKTFQAIRIHLNRELDELQVTLKKAIELLSSGGRLVVISFHSLEDRIVKQFMRNNSRSADIPPEIPLLGGVGDGVIRLIGKAIKAGVDELAVNPRARSAVLRVAEKR